MSHFIHCYAGCRFDECRYAECHYAECCYAECRYGQCHYAECHYAECRDTFLRPVKYLSTVRCFTIIWSSLFF